MPFLDPITQLINDSIKASTLSDSRFQQGSWNKIATLVPKTEGDATATIPTIVGDIDGDVTEVGFDDRYPFIIYHRVESITHSDGDLSGDEALVRETANMLAVVYGDRNTLMMPQEQLISGVIAGFPTVLTQAQKNQWNLSVAEIDTGNVNNNPRSVWAGEVGSEFPLKPNHILFSVNYTIITEFAASCLNICT